MLCQLPYFELGFFANALNLILNVAVHFSPTVCVTEQEFREG
jgi:hypothetical protein